MIIIVILNNNNNKKCIKVVHPKEAIEQIGLVQQQIRFNSVIKLRKSLLSQENISNKIAELIQRELDDDIGNINVTNENSLNIDCVSIDIRKDYYDSQVKSKLQQQTSCDDDLSNDYFAVVVSWSLEVKNEFCCCCCWESQILKFFLLLQFEKRTKSSALIFARLSRTI